MSLYVSSGGHQNNDLKYFVLFYRCCNSPITTWREPTRLKFSYRTQHPTEVPSQIKTNTNENICKEPSNFNADKKHNDAKPDAKAEEKNHNEFCKKKLLDL